MRLCGATMMVDGRVPSAVSRMLRSLARCHEMEANLSSIDERRRILAIVPALALSWLGARSVVALPTDKTIRVGLLLSGF